SGIPSRQDAAVLRTSAAAGRSRFLGFPLRWDGPVLAVHGGNLGACQSATRRQRTAELGFANPMLYSLNGSSAVTDIVDPASTVAAVRINYNNGEDATSGTSVRLRTMNQTLSLHTTPGWDDVTGIGTPTSTFVGALSKYTTNRQE